MCTLGDVKSPRWVFVTARVMAVVILSPSLAPAERTKTNDLIQIDPGEERVRFSVGTTF